MIRFGGIRRTLEELSKENKSLTETNSRLSSSLKSERETVAQSQKDAELKSTKIKELEGLLVIHYYLNSPLSPDKTKPNKIKLN